jgi:nitrate reductase NapE component
LVGDEERDVVDDDDVADDNVPGLNKRDWDIGFWVVVFVLFISLAVACIVVSGLSPPTSSLASS